jgi:hypothetical protein
LAQTQTTDVLGAMPQYRPLPTGVRVGNNQEDLVRRAANVTEAAIRKVDEEVAPKLQQAAEKISQGKSGSLADVVGELEHLKSMVEKVVRITDKAKDS